VPAVNTADTDPPRWTINARVETLLLGASVFWALAVNQRFFAGALAGHPGSSLGFTLALGLALVALHFLLLAPFATRATVKPLLALMFVATAFAAHYMNRLGLYLDPSMLRNVLRTDLAEASELFTPSLVPDLLLLAGLPMLLLWRVRLVRRGGWVSALGLRIASVGVAAALLVGTVVAQYQPLASLMRNHKELRYLVTPANYLWSLASVFGREARASGPKTPIGTDARPGESWQDGGRARVVVFVVGETARAANWGLDGYARQTTPELATLPVVTFGDVTSCGTNTEVSVPCMFSALGRRHYDERAIRGSESLLNLLARAGVGVRWRDNQAGWKRLKAAG
jgi:lipid A ethanolaminephosphotransferase